MSKKARLIVVLVVLELLMAAGWWYLNRFGLAHPDRVQPGFHQTIGQVMGGCMGALLGFGLLMFFIAARNDARNR